MTWAVRDRAVFLAAAFLTGLLITVVSYGFQPVNGKVFIGFGVVYGWLAVFTALSFSNPVKERTLLTVGGAPTFFIAVVSLVLSFPFHVLPALFLYGAIASTRDRPPRI
ncbi:MAG TPA: hypothetical protein VG845_10105 [Dehalococcoidia bacterium]|nr:hypothetical protein [Dehalococcoidia bacterium]